METLKKTEPSYDYHRVEAAIRFIDTHFKSQPQLDEVADHVHLSPYHFQRLFTKWAGVSPKKFLQYISLNHARALLREAGSTLSQAAIETGLSGTSRLHDLFVNIEGMTPAEYRNGGADLQINYSFTDTPFGSVFIASTSKGVCFTTFVQDEEKGLAMLMHEYPNACLKQKLDQIQENALYIFTRDWSTLEQIKLHLKGSAFQLKVWEALIKIPVGNVTTYKVIAENIQHPKASRAVGSAVGSNPIAYIIPCHRVIQSSGYFGQYHWGATRKKAMLGWEMAKMEAV